MNSRPQALSEYITPVELSELVNRALAEDVGPGDVTTIGALGARGSETVSATLRVKVNGVVAGCDVFTATFQACDERVRCEWRVADGGSVSSGQELARVEGPLSALLAGERTALNFFGRMSGVATLTARFVSRIAGTNCKILDTRKTLPGLRTLDKYAVICGGGLNHRYGLYDMALIKDNHITAAGSLTRAFEATRAYLTSDACLARFNSLSWSTRDDIEVEVKNETELREALSVGARHVLLDNQTPETLRKLTLIAREFGKSVGQQVTLEASGGVTVENVSAFAASGVDYISVGAITHSAPWLDVSLKIDLPS